MEKKKSSKRAKQSDFDGTKFGAVKEYLTLAVPVVGIWYFGYSRCSLGWLLLPLVYYVVSETKKDMRRQKTIAAQEIARNEQAVVQSLGEDLPSWVRFSRVERAEWMNKILKQLWPYITDQVEIILRQSVEKSIRAQLPPKFKSFKFSKIDLGDQPPRISGVEFHDGLRKKEMSMDVEVGYNSDVNVKVSIKGINSGIRDVSLNGTMRVVMKPLMNKMPLIGGLQVFFLETPDFNFDMTGLTNVLDVSFINDKLIAIIEDGISGICVLPNRFPIKLSDRVNLNRLRFPPPQGVVRVTIIEAKDIIKLDLGGRGKSDPYVAIKVGAILKKTRVLNNQVNPVWNEMFELCVDEADGQRLTLVVYDSDPGKDGFCGRASMNLATLRKQGSENTWLPLEGVKSGSLHVQVLWLWLADDPHELARNVQKIPKGLKQKYTYSSAILMCFIDSARNIPKTKEQAHYRCEITVGTTSRKTTVYKGNEHPKWEQSFRFFIFNPKYQFLDLKLEDIKAKEVIGKTTVKLKDLLSCENMLMYRKFVMDSGSFIIMRLCLRILTHRGSTKWLKMQPDLMDSPNPEDLIALTDTNSFYKPSFKKAQTKQKTPKASPKITR